MSDWKSKKVNEYNKTIEYYKEFEKFLSAKNEALRLSKKHKITLEIYDGNFLSRKKKCSWPFTSAFIATNGDVVPCCVISDADVIKMGNIFEQPYKEIWNSNKYKEFRRLIREHNLNDFCKSCYGEE